MDRRTGADLALVVVAAVVAYVQTYGWSDPAAGFREILAMARSVDPTVYLVIAGVIGLVFVGYIAVYLPKRVSEGSSREPGE